MKKTAVFSPHSRASVDLPVRPKELYDGAIPSANSVALFQPIAFVQIDRRSAMGRPGPGSDPRFCRNGDIPAVRPLPIFCAPLTLPCARERKLLSRGTAGRTDTRELLSALNLNFTPNKVAIVKIRAKRRAIKQICRIHRRPGGH